MDGAVTAVLEGESFEYSPDSPLTGRLYIRAGENSFPDSEWNDCVVIVMTWWLEALSGLEHQNQPAEFRFMDGPFAVRVERLRNDQAEFRFVDTARDTSMLPSMNASASGFVGSLIDASLQIDHFINSLRLESKDIADFRTALSRISHRF